VVGLLVLGRAATRGDEAGGLVIVIVIVLVMGGGVSSGRHVEYDLAGKELFVKYLFNFKIR